MAISEPITTAAAVQAVLGIDLVAMLSGAAFGASLIVAIGAQNAYVLRQGLRGEHVGLVIAVCALSDAVLIVAGVAGASALLERAPGLLTAIRIGGALFLITYAVLALRRALRPTNLDPTAGDDPTSARVALATVLALTWLNPHVYLDTVVLLGSVASTHGDARWSFAGGAALASCIWFTALGRGAALLRPLFAKPVAWRVLDGFVAVVMSALAVTLVAGT
ncbi:MAG: LysE/ArgO family amino acid transporter [Solirubrobacteraceae bacterium]|nr:LysE/ArgO family amino acid transporter [Solirubrobacteraceae bacterium]